MPRKVFIYRSIVESLREMASRDDFLLKCELWRQQHIYSDEDLGVYMMVNYGVISKILMDDHFSLFQIICVWL